MSDLSAEMRRVDRATVARLDAEIRRLRAANAALAHALREQIAPREPGNPFPVPNNWALRDERARAALAAHKEG